MIFSRVANSEGVQNFVSVNQKLIYSAEKGKTDMTEEENGFDFETALKAIKEGKPLLGKEGILTPLIKNLTEAALEGELDSHLGQEIAANRRNGKSQKTIKAVSPHTFPFFDN